MAAESIDWIAGAGGPIQGECAVPGDKSISHRALMLAAIAEGSSHVSGFLEGEDTCATARILQQLGVRIETPALGERIVHGVGLYGLRASALALDCGNAGTGIRLLAGLLAGQAFDSLLVGDASLRRRPMGRVIDPLKQMGAQIESADGGMPPLHIHASTGLRGIDYEARIASAQVKSAILLAGLYASGTTRVIEPVHTRDYTERMLAAFGWPIRFAPGRAELEGGHVLRGIDFHVPGDFSSAAFGLVAACIVPRSELLVHATGMNPRRTGLLAALRMMGADISERDPREVGGEAIADLRVCAAALRGIDLPQHLVPEMIDEFPAFFVAAACAEGTTRVRGASELRVKESDRLAGMASALRALGVAVEEFADGALIHGIGPNGAFHPATVDSLGDHRIAMALAVAAQRANGDVRIRDCANVATSFPAFDTWAQAIGMHVQRARDAA